MRREAPAPCQEDEVRNPDQDNDARAESVIARNAEGLDPKLEQRPKKAALKRGDAWRSGQDRGPDRRLDIDVGTDH